MKLDYTDPATLTEIIEALVFASDEPLSALDLRTLVLGEQYAPRSTEADTSQPSLDDQTTDEADSSLQAKPKRRQVLELPVIKDTVALLNNKYETTNSSFHIIEIAGGYQYATRSEYAAYVSRLYKERSRRRLSGAALETLAIIAYKQPVSKSDVENIRGVNCDEVLRSLLEKNLITITGRAEGVGRPLLYGTTGDFLRHFGLPSMKDLPKPREIEELLKDESIRATTLDEAAEEFVDPDAAQNITVDEVIAASKEDNHNAQAYSESEAEAIAEEKSA